VTTARTSDLWWKNAVIYCLDPETFLDWNDDGIGDLTGLTERVDYLAGMGITCIWLMPFYPSPNRDDGYDITDYYGVDPALGTLGDFVALVRTAKDRGIRVIVDLVVNHTSDRHPWFRAARSSPDSPFRDFYVWRDEPPADGGPSEPVFPDAEGSVWSFDEQAGQWYLHHFYGHQPDLNIKTAAVREEISKIAGFWLQVGVDGFRVDAVPFLLEEGGIGGDVDLDPHEFLRDFRSFVSRRRGDSLMLGEVNLPAETLPQYFGRDGDEIQLLFNFPVMQRMYLSLARGDARPLADALRKTEPVEGAGFANFVRNHDELTLDQLTEDEREEVFAAFGPEEHMQLFGRGLRRRLPPMLGGDQQRIRMVYSLLFSLPGTPVLFYGEEIGMGENLDVPGRMSVRTPMQWSDDENGGFSQARPSKLRRPVVEGRYSPLAVNVAAQRRDPDSLLSWTERLIRRRRETPEIGWGSWQVLKADTPSVLAHRCDWEGRTIVALHNLSAETCIVRIEIGDVPRDARVDDLLDGEVNVAALDGSALELKLEGYGFRWFRLTPAERTSAP
jgi:trehalose synthase